MAKHCSLLLNFDYGVDVIRERNLFNIHKIKWSKSTLKMAVKKIFFNFAFAIGLVMCAQGLEVHQGEKNYHFGEYKAGDVPIMVNQKAIVKKQFGQHDNILTFVVPPPDEELRDKLPSEKSKDLQYIPSISEIVVSDQGSGSVDCHIVNGGIGKYHVTLNFVNFLRTDIDYLVTLNGQ